MLTMAKARFSPFSSGKAKLARVGLVAAAALAVTLACGGSGSDDGVSRTVESNLVATSGTVTLAVPALVEVESTAVVANERADLGDNFTVNGTGSRAIVAMDGTGMLLRNDARVGDIFGRPAVTLLDQVTVSGSIFSATTATVPSSTTLSGIVVNDYAFEPAVTFSWSFEAPATSRGDLAIAPDQSPYALPPGTQ
jgi:hypothetical protein